MDDAKGLEDGQTSSPLLLRENPDPGSSSSATAAVILSTLVAVSGSFVFGSAVGYSSPAQTGIMDELGLSLAELKGIRFWREAGQIKVFTCSELAMFYRKHFLEDEKLFT